MKALGTRCILCEGDTCETMVGCPSFEQVLHLENGKRGRVSGVFVVPILESGSERYSGGD
jgi:hypothetical protein